MKGLFDPRLDLGVRRLLPAWRALGRAEHLREDLIAGLTVACVAVPLSLAIALASGVPPATGLVTAIVAGVVCAFFGGTTLAVSGPAVAMTVLAAAIVQAHGIGGLLVAGLCCGLLQLATGVLGLGKIIRLVPVSVVEGFTAGMGAIILIGQLPRVLGLPPPEQSHVVDVITHIGDLFHQARPASALTAIATLALVFGFSRLDRRIPAALFAVAIPTVIVAALGIRIETIGDIPRSLPLPHVPALPKGEAWSPILGTALVVYALASLESLLSSSAVDKLARSERHDPDQEMIGQGLGNIASALVGGLPVTGVIARSALNVQSGARTRRAAVIHSLALIAIVLFLAPLIARIPVAALAGVLLSVALRMLDPRKLVAMARATPSDAVIYAITFAVMVFTDLVEGVQWGVVAALAVAAVRLGQSRVNLQHRGGSPSRLELTGAITFLASLEIEALKQRIAQAKPGSSVILDATGATAMDASGAEMLVDLVASMKQRELSIALYGLRPDLMKVAVAADHAGALEGVCANTESDLASLLFAADPAPVSTRQRLVAGVDRYRRDLLPRYTKLFQRLAEKQTPHTLLITCADSRIQPALMTSTDPGELFIVRNVGNMVPPYSEARPPPAGAALEYAVGVLGVKAIILCAHSRCGAIHALTHPHTVPPSLVSLRAWLDDTEALRMVSGLPSGLSEDDIARLNALLQLDHVRTFPLVRERVEAGALRLFAWFFDVGTGEIEEWSPETKRWVPLTASQIHASTAPPALATADAVADGAPAAETRAAPV
ncbi:MAG: bifunctional SulP family inorganic anion transporter/carbonic anhydrase [Minicystis sp.]